jgi:O-antigen/teichoic acid export membrane protein
MIIRTRISRTSRLLIATVLLVSSPAAFAYLDPSTGSMVVSAIVGIFASIALAVKTYWYRIKAFFSRDKKSGTAPRESNE